MRVGEHLDLDVPRILEVLLDVDGGVGEVRLAPRAARTRSAARGLVAADATTFRPLPPPPAAALIAIGQPMLVAERDRLVGGSAGSVVPGTIGTPAACIAARAAVFVAHQLDRLRRRPDPDEPGVLDGAAKRGVLGEEAVAGVNGLRAGAARRLERAARRRDSSRPRAPGR